MCDFRAKYESRMSDLQSRRDVIKIASEPLRKKYEDEERSHKNAQDELWAQIQSCEADLPDIEGEIAALAQMLSSRNVRIGI
jgi:hypothetical protein